MGTDSEPTRRPAEKPKNFLPARMPARVRAQEPTGLPQWLGEWLATLGPEGASLRRNYGHAFGLVAARVAASGGVAAIGPAEAQRIAQWLRTEAPVLDARGHVTGRRGRAPATVALAVSGLSSLWEALIRKGEAATNPWRHLRRERPRLRVREKYLSEDEVAHLIEAPAWRDERALVATLYYCGCRISELVRPAGLRDDDPHGVRWRDLMHGADGWHLTVYGKRGKTRTVGVPAPAMDRLLEMRERHWALGHGEDADPLWPHHRQWANRMVARAAKAAGINRPVSPHWLRHTHAHIALDRGAPINVVQATLGHASLATTSIYTQVDAGRGSGAYLGPQGGPQENRAGDI